MNDSRKGYDGAGKYKCRIDLSNEKVSVVQLGNCSLGMTRERESVATTNRNLGEK